MTCADITVLAPAYVAGLLVLATHVPLGREVLRRGIIFVDLAIAQLAGLGVIAAQHFGVEAHGWQVQAAAIGAALGGALLLTWTERLLPDIQEALIGSLFVLAASGSILLLAGNPHGGEHLHDLLAGQILWVEWRTLWQTALLYAVVLLLWLRLPPTRLGFYALFALAVTASVQLVGIYLVFASLILPALACRHHPHPLRAAYLFGGLGYFGGLLLSAWFDLPSGALIVVVLAGLAGGVMVWSEMRSRKTPAV